MEPQERRIAIWRSLCCHRSLTVARLATEYGVSVRTIYYDVQKLSLIYDIELTVFDCNISTIDMAIKMNKRYVMSKDD